ncbi:hypothetical protein K402DRAFT_374200 [Aulographum hederae CBS 113979]|uniref:Tat pathway signal sequence n=1 Tax=Aulographum hederae CBS 113979 TaxID=1176131 RepID=A0A6G1H5P9_9PEZI|nr:hypothetical protein K402DRAFT_374200 [Aulographum hederae CBS 113979]
MSQQKEEKYSKPWMQIFAPICDIFGRRSNQTFYRTISEEEEGQEASIPSYHVPKSATPYSQTLFTINIWFFTTISLLLLLLLQTLHWNPFNPNTLVAGTYERGFATELEDAKASVHIEQRRFTNAIRDLENGTLYPYFEDARTPRYVGAPGSEIDANWDKLLRGRYIHLQDSEIDWLERDSYLPPLTSLPHRPSVGTPGIYGGPDVLHNLHCLNALRKHLDLDYYEPSMQLPLRYRRMHIEHCIDQLRQAVMCHGDLTPVTLKPVWVGGGEKDNERIGDGVLYLLGQTERMHTCRRWEDIREWVEQRGEEGGAVLTH